jgi:hypothetical protein
MRALEELVSSEESDAPRRFPWRRVAIAAAFLILLWMAIFLPPLINLGKYRHSITVSMSEALGRPVYVGGMQLRLVPSPGIVMSDFTVDEDPAFGSEPALHATSVVASLRLTSLWRGRLEVSRISLDEANLNLVKSADGQWSIGSVLLRASQIPNAPTGERHVSARARFPYIEATDARIDFKDGAEKKPFSLVNAEFSMWQASGDEWRVRLRAQPVRTDLLQPPWSGVGELNVEGSMRRAALLDAMPADLRVEWTGAQLGQMSRLLVGLDTGWRGNIDVTTTIRGNLGDLHLQTRLRVADLRRQEFQPPATINVDANCRSDYRRARRAIDNITCFWPVAAGHLLLTGNMQGFAAPQADLQLEINQVPASFPVGILELMRPGAQNVTVTGTVNGNFRLVTGERRVLVGDASATGVMLRYPGGNLNLPPLHFVAPPAQPPPPRRLKQPLAPAPPPPLQNAIQMQPIAIPMGAPEPLLADARLTRDGYEIHTSGQATLARLLPAAASFGLLENAATIVAPRGRASLDLTTAGNWMRPVSGASSGIATTGSLKVEAAQLKPAFLPTPVEVQSAQVALSPDEIAWQDVSLTWQKMPMQGSIQFPTTCNQPVACPATFTLSTGPLNAAAIEAAVAGNSGNGLLGQFLNNALGGNHLAPWPSMKGQISCVALDLGQLPLHDVAVAVRVEQNTLTLSFLDAATLGGILHGTAEMSMDDGTPRWKLNLHVAGAQSSEIAAVFGEHWGTGVVSGETALTMSGYRTEDLASSITGDFSFIWQNGSLANPATPNEAALARFDRWTAKGTIAHNTITFTSGGIARAARTTPLGGTISFDRDLDLTLDAPRGAVKITGTLSQPLIANSVTAP